MRNTKCDKIQRAWRNYKNRKKTVCSVFENLYNEYLVAEQYYILTDDELPGSDWLYTRIDIFNKFAGKLDLVTGKLNNREDV